MRTALAAVLAAAALAPGASRAEAVQRFAIEPDQVLASFQVTFGTKQLVAVSRALSGSIEVQGGNAVVKLHAPLETFTSGNFALDEAVRSVLSTGPGDHVELEGSASGLPDERGEDVIQLKGTLRLHGTSLPVVVPVRVVRNRGFAFAHLTFSFSLASVGVEGLSLSTVRAADMVEVTVDARLVRDQHAVVARAN